MADCPTSAGFTTAIGCGNFGTLTRCKVVSLAGLLQGCAAGTTVPDTQQACK